MEENIDFSKNTRVKLKYHEIKGFWCPKTILETVFNNEE